jgi:orotate phosphoribosyltransferase
MNIMGCKVNGQGQRKKFYPPLPPCPHNGFAMDTTSYFSYIRVMTNEQVVAEKLLQINAIKLSPETPYTWASGWKSPVYCDNRKALSFPYIRDFIKSEMCNLIFEKFPSTELLAGVATAGIAWGAMAADQLKLPYVYVRSKPKDHGLGNQIEGYFEAGQKVLVVEDLISTGKSSLEVVEVLRSSGLEPVGMISIFTYGFSIAQDAFAKAGVPYISLTNYETLVQLAIKKGIVSAAQEMILLNWRNNPAEWKGVM